MKEEEINLLSIAYKNTVGNRRTAWRAISAYEMKEMSKVLIFIVYLIIITLTIFWILI